MAVTGKILITGCQGQLGMDLMGYLCDHATVVGIDQADVDICNFTGLLETFRAIKPQWVIHTAAYTDVDGCEANPGLAQAINADGTENVARAATKVGANMLYYSTDYVFDGHSNRPYLETDEVNPQTAYGRSKADGEERVKVCVDNYVVMRISWVYGLYGKNFVKTILRLGREFQEAKLSGKALPPLKVVDDQHGNPTWTAEIARQTKVILDSGIFGLLHATSEGETTWYRLARQIFDEMHIAADLEPCSSEQFPRPAPRPKYSVLENARLKEAGLNLMSPHDAALHQFLSTHGEKL
ncbi:MAG: dTDP-4-dehydrorhamnose reductase [bacterium]|nr:dTDP-4-dehydrorhamnose reductase [bacterium]